MGLYVAIMLSSFEINVSIRPPLPKSPGWSCVFLDMPLPDVIQVQSSNLGTVQCTEYHSMIEEFSSGLFGESREYSAHPRNKIPNQSMLKPQTQASTERRESMTTHGNPLGKIGILKGWLGDARIYFHEGREASAIAMDQARF